MSITVQIEPGLISVVKDNKDTLFQIEECRGRIQVLNSCGFISPEDNILALAKTIEVIKLLTFWDKNENIS